MVSTRTRLHKKLRPLLLHGGDREAGTASVDGVQDFPLLVEARALDSGTVAGPPFYQSCGVPVTLRLLW